MQKIIIHAGTPKTGSTSIQKNLFLNQNKEKKQISHISHILMDLKVI